MSLTRPEIKKLDEYWSQIIKWVKDYRCEHCGVYGMRVEAAHVVGRRHRATRWGYWLLNIETLKDIYDWCGHCLCHRCHQEYDEHGPLEPAIVEQTIGRERKDRIQRHATVTIAKHQYFDEIKATMLELVKDYEKKDGYEELEIHKPWKQRGKHGKS